MIKVGIIGATGYAGAELVRILLNHKEVTIDWLASKSYVGQMYADVYPNMFRLVDEECLDDDIESMADEVDVIFTATPQGYLSKILTEDILSRTKVIDLSADYRIKDMKVYEKWYGITHGSPQLIEKAVYGLCEIHREEIRSASLTANPGCFTTCSILTAYPLIKEGLIDGSTLIIDAKSGTSGAGRGAKQQNLFCEVNENIKAYGVTTHRHTPEIEQELSLAAGRDIFVSFTPHLVPMNRGILATEYAALREVRLPDGSFGYPTSEMITEAYEKLYGSEKFIRLLGEGGCPETRWVEGSNFTDIGFKIDERTHRIVMMGALDNLVKG
nr:N-acetyl-gamma-glutamyl-phosphate reductase [Lachnospiraceae bacterium]